LNNLPVRLRLFDDRKHYIVSSRDLIAWLDGLNKS
jgi:hypothetical protein